jgi:hypothetical protein
VQRENLNTVIQKIKSKPNLTALSVWDIDDTLYHVDEKHKLKIIVKHPITKKVLKELTTADFANVNKISEELMSKHKIFNLTFDYSMFTDSSFFYNYAKPIQRNFPTAINEFKSHNNFFMVLTARSNMDIKELFLQRFEDDGLNLISEYSKSHLVRKGSTDYVDKGKVLNDILKTVTSNNKNLTDVRFWDDNSGERKSVETISKQFPQITFTITDAINGSSKKLLNGIEKK